MKVHEIMTAHARCISPDNTLVEAAGLMRELDVGSLPVCESDHVVGIVTDRDIVLRGTANGVDPNSAAVSSVMSRTVVTVSADQAVEDAVRMMEDRQIRRLPVLGRDGRLVGILALGDVAISSSPAFSGMALRDVSEPRDPTARQQRLSRRSQPSAMPRTGPEVEERSPARLTTEPKRAGAAAKRPGKKTKASQTTKVTARTKPGKANSRKSTSRSRS